MKTNNISRRSFLKILGLGSATAAVGAGLWRAGDQGVFSIGKGAAYDAWQNGQNSGEIGLVQAAILAASPHNSQPWLFQIGDGQVHLYADSKRNLGAVDPFLREMHLGLGCAIENLNIAAGANGYEANLSYLPQSIDPTYIARLDLASGSIRDRDLYAAIPMRHTNRGPFDPSQQVSSLALDTFEEIVYSEPDVQLFLFTSESDKQEMGDLVIQATEAFIADQEMSADTFGWTRKTWQELQENRDGITLDSSGMPLPMLSLVKMLPPVSLEQNNQGWLKSTRETHTATASGFGLLAIKEGDDRIQQLKCGRLWQRMHLAAQNLGVAMHPLNQPVELFARETYLGSTSKFTDQLAKLMGGQPWTPMLAFRFGYATREAIPSPRRPVEAVLI
jgi:hypothetical protein